jgi:pantoate kinase
MTVKLGRGECGGHVTLFFTIMDKSEKIVEQGSFGAGLCVKHGVEAITRGEEGDFGLQINYINDNGDDQLYQEVMKILLNEIPEIGNYSWELNIKTSLPLSQGFGMSGAGAVAAASSFQRALGISHEETRRRSYLIAHSVERIRSTGLGDVTALSAGGVERRVAVGSPYSGLQLNSGPGKAEGWFEEMPIILAWKSETGKHTSNYIDNEEWKKKITASGNKAMEVISKGKWDKNRWKELIRSTQEFVIGSELIMDSKRNELLFKSNNLIKDCKLEEEVVALLCMLGESVVIVPKNINFEKIETNKICKKFNQSGFQTIITNLSNNL